MDGNTETTSEERVEDTGRSDYERSTISFPYFDLAEARRIASAMSRNVGAGDAADEQLASYLDLSPKSSGYRGRVSAARIFGLLRQVQGGTYQLTDLGLRAVDETRQRAALAEAFLLVPLFERVYEQWKGQQLPPPAALERQMIEMGVAKKQTARARQVLERSALTAGFFESGRDRLVRPGIKDDHITPRSDEERQARSGDGGGSGGGSGDGGTIDVDPIIAGLLRRLPKPGTKWPKSQRKLWLNLMEGSFDLIYEDETAGRQEPEQNA